MGEGGQALDAPVDKFRDWQEITNSIFCSRPLGGLRQQMEVWFDLNEEPQLRSQHTRRRTRKNLHPRSSEARQESFCPLDKVSNRTSLTVSALSNVLLAHRSVHSEEWSCFLSFDLCASPTTARV